MALGSGMVPGSTAPGPLELGEAIPAGLVGSDKMVY